MTWKPTVLSNRPAANNPTLARPDAVTDVGLSSLQRQKPLRLGFPRLERLALPQSENFWVLGGRPGSFKTALLWNWACNAAAMGQRVLFVSLEMPMGWMAVQAVARYSGVPMRQIQASYRKHDQIPLSPTDKAKVDEGILHFASLYGEPDDMRLLMHGGDEHGRSIRSILGSCRRAFFDAVFVDHLGMIGRQDGHELVRLGEAIDGLRALARGEVSKDNRPFVCAVSPLNREIDKDGSEDKGQRAPRLSDFRGSNRIEHDSDVAMVLQKVPGHGESDMCPVEGFVLKNRNGPAPSVVRLTAMGSTGLVTETHGESEPAKHWSDAE